MAEEARKSGPVTDEDVIAYLKAKNAEAPCQACQSDSWTILADDDTDTNLGIPVVTPDEGRALSNINMIALVCNNCSNTRFFWKFKVENWRNSNRDRVAAQNE